jgi:ABC-type branched-subunit amino acid transport system ATPase component
MDVQEKEIVSLIGRNGVGRTSTLKAVMGLTHLVSGTTHFDSKEFSRLPTYRRGRTGIAYVPDDKGGLRGNPREPIEKEIAIWKKPFSESSRESNS